MLTGINDQTQHSEFYYLFTQTILLSTEKHSSLNMAYNRGWKVKIAIVLAFQLVCLIGLEMKYTIDGSLGQSVYSNIIRFTCKTLIWLSTYCSSQTFWTIIFPHSFEWILPVLAKPTRKLLYCKGLLKNYESYYNLWQYRLGQSSFHMHSVVIYHLLIHFFHPPSPQPFQCWRLATRVRKCPIPCTTAKFFARNCTWAIPLNFPTTHWWSEIFSPEA